MRSLLDGIRLALRAIVRNPLRAVAHGARDPHRRRRRRHGHRARRRARASTCRQQIQAIGSNFIIVFPQRSQASGARGAQGAGMRLTEDDGRAILRDASSLVAIAPVAARAACRSSTAIRTGRRRSSARRESYFTVRNWPVERGASLGRARRGREVEGRRPRHHRGAQALRYRGPVGRTRPHRALSVPGPRRPRVEGGGAVRRRSGRHRPHAVDQLARARPAHAARASPARSWPRRRSPETTERAVRADRRASCGSATASTRDAKTTSRSARRRSSPSSRTRSTAS